ncbi:hypothetical protein MHU86_11834 [Fragilaria crotonensis]|nr:hypothetical protein MHU86_11834 [Fragilaria crotonensis]
MAELDARKMRNHAVFLQLVKQYLDDEDEDANTMAFSDHEFWSYVGIDSDICQNYDLLTEQDFSDALSYINFHYQASYQKNKQSGNHGDFVNFVGSRHFLFYHHLWLSEYPHLLLNFAVPLLPSGAERQTAGSSDSSSAKQSRLLRKQQMSQRDSVSASASSMQQHQEIAKALASLEKTNSERIKILKESAAPRRERELLNVYYIYKERMKTARKSLVRKQNLNMTQILRM